LPCRKIKGWGRKFGNWLEDFRRPLPETLERTRCFAAATQWARIDRQAIQRLREDLTRCFGLLFAGGIETRICIFAPTGGGTGVPDQIEFRHGFQLTMDRNNPKRI